MEGKIMRVVQQGEAFAVQSQKSETGQVKKCNILLQELGGKYADQYACTMLGNAATCRFSRDELVPSASASRSTSMRAATIRTSSWRTSIA